MAGRRTNEAELAGRWAAGEWRGWRLCTPLGEEYTLVFQGRRGGPAGPDFRDAVLACADGTRIRGDIELHLQPGGWYAHAHASDARYNDVVLHVTSSAGTRRAVAVPLASGRTAPQAALEHALPPSSTRGAPQWPCERLGGQLGHAAVRTLLLDAGAARFAQRALAFEGALTGKVRASVTPVRGQVCQVAGMSVLATALAEGLGFGRDRAALRSAGERLVARETPAAILDAACLWQRVERKRLEGLLQLWQRWDICGPWAVLDPLARALPPHVAARALIAGLAVAPGLVSPGRAAILAANVVLPFAAAWASLMDDGVLGSAAREVYAALPGLPSNQITREMMRQIGLPRLPAGAAAQQGLHHLWNEFCRDKRCSTCPCNAATVARST